MSTWAAVLGAGVLSFLIKLAGHLVPGRWLEHPRALRAATLLPVALLSALVAVQTLAGPGGSLVLDARAVGLLAAVVALLLRAPFLVVVVVAAVVAAGVRALT